MSYTGYETSYTSYSAGGGGGGGGGFMPDGGSQQSPSGRRDYAQDTLRPVTIKQLLAAQPEPGSENFKIDGVIVTQITFVAQIRNISTQTTNTAYKLDDGTGSVEVKLWNNQGEEDQPDPMKAALVEGAYCRTWARIKSYTERRQIIAQIMRPVEDMNEVSFHFLEATAVHLYMTRGPPGGSNAGAGAAGVNGAPQQQQAAGGGYGGYDLAGYNQVAKRVFQYLREAPQSNEGLHQQEIAAKLGIDTPDVARAGDELLAGGLIYTTVDDQTWAILEAD